MGAAAIAVVLIVVLDAGASPPAGITAQSCTPSASPCTLAAGGQAVTVTFKNNEKKSTSALVVTLAASPGAAPFSIASNTCAGTALGPGKTCTVGVQYGTPAPNAEQTATLTVASRKAPLISSAAAYFRVAGTNHPPVASDDAYDD